MNKLDPSRVISELRARFEAYEDIRNDQPAPEEYDTAFFDNLNDALSSLSPEGSTVRAFGIPPEKVLRAGYRVVDSGQADIAIGRGGEHEFDLARRARCKRLLLCPTRDYTACASPFYRTTDKAFGIMRYGQKPHAAVFDTEAPQNLASVFGEIAALDLCAFDLAFGACMRGERINAELVSSVAKLTDGMIAALKKTEKRSRETAQTLFDYGKRAAKIVERTPELLHTSGAAQTTEALRMLRDAEGSPSALRGETEMLIGGYIISFYIKCLAPARLLFPPDNNRRADRVCKYLGGDVKRACVYATSVYPPEKLKLCEYRFKEFRAELMRMLAELKNRYTAAWRVFKRLYPDDGYGLKTLVDPTDFSLCLALAPDVFNADSMLSFLKQTGRLEKYIV